MQATMRNPYRLSFGEELANSVSHGVMGIIILLTLPYYTVRSYQISGWNYTIGVSVFLIGMFFMFMTSCLYHTSQYGTTYKYVMRKLDHIMIVVAIAGTYTPVCLNFLNNKWGLVLLAIEWSMALAAILLKAIAKKSYPKISMGIYMLMGWLAIFFVPQLLQKEALPFMGLVLLGGIFYSIGAVFYTQPKKRYFHFIWHLFIILASVSHMIAILYFMY